MLRWYVRERCGQGARCIRLRPLRVPDGPYRGAVADIRTRGAAQLEVHRLAVVLHVVVDDGHRNGHRRLTRREGEFTAGRLVVRPGGRRAVRGRIGHRHRVRCRWRQLHHEVQRCVVALGRLRISHRQPRVADPGAHGDELAVEQVEAAGAAPTVRTAYNAPPAGGFEARPPDVEDRAVRQKRYQRGEDEQQRGGEGARREPTHRPRLRRSRRPASPASSSVPRQYRSEPHAFHRLLSAAARFRFPPALCASLLPAHCPGRSGSRTSALPTHRRPAEHAVVRADLQNRVAPSGPSVSRYNVHEVVAQRPRGSRSTDAIAVCVCQRRMRLARMAEVGKSFGSTRSTRFARGTLA